LLAGLMKISSIPPIFPLKNLPISIPLFLWTYWWMCFGFCKTLCPTSPNFNMAGSNGFCVWKKWSCQILWIVLFCVQKNLREKHWWNIHVKRRKKQSASPSLASNSIKRAWMTPKFAENFS
jgi:hypothetical protein